MRARRARADAWQTAVKARDAVMDEDVEPEPLSSAIVLAEDKKYYPSADEARGCARVHAAAARARAARGDMRRRRAAR